MMSLEEEAQPGDLLVLDKPHNGWDHQKLKAQKLIEEYGENPIFTLTHKEIHNWYTDFYFEEIDGAYNSVQFSFYEDKND